MVDLKILKNGDKYTATHKERGNSICGAGEIFEISEQLERKELNDYLLSKGFHQRDIFDAFDMANGTSINIPHPLFNGNKNPQ